jgi:CRISP-associated protein Cas1
VPGCLPWPGRDDYTIPAPGAARHGIDVVLLGEHGSSGGRLTSLVHSDPTARRAQCRLADDATASRALAAAFVDGRVANMRVALLRAGRREPGAELTAVAETLAVTRLVLAEASSSEEILGYEVSATREYFRA